MPIIEAPGPHIRVDFPPKKRSKRKQLKELPGCRSFGAVRVPIRIYPTTQDDSKLNDQKALLLPV
eukprot:6461929-Amphidinium_carterae.1